MLLSKFMYFIHLHHICGINRETGVSQGSRSQSRQDTPSVTATMSSSLLSFWQHAFLHILFYIRFRRMVKVTSTLTTTQAQMMMGSDGYDGVFWGQNGHSVNQIRHQCIYENA